MGDELAAGGLDLCGFGKTVADIVGVELSSFRGDGVVVGINVVVVIIVGTVVSDDLGSDRGDAVDSVGAALGTNVDVFVGLIIIGASV